MTISKERKKQLKAVIGCVGIMAVYYFLMKTSTWIVTLLDFKSPVVSMLFNEFLYSVSALGLMKLLGIKLSKVLFRPLNRYGKKILIVYLILITFNSAVKFSGFPTRPLYEIIFFTMTMLLVGIAEECVFRGIIAESMLRTFGTNRKGCTAAALISGAMFGFIHIINASSAELSGVLVQCAGAFVMGAFFSHLYYSTRCLALNIFIHAAIDWSNLICYGFYGEGSVHEIISGYSPLMLIPISISLVLFLLLCSTKPVEPLKNTA